MDITSIYIKPSKELVFRDGGLFAVRTAIDENDKIYFFSNDKLSLLSSGFVVEHLLHIYDPSLNEWKTHTFLGFESFALTSFLCVRRKKLYGLFEDAALYEDVENRFVVFLVIDLETDFQAVILKKMHKCHYDVTGDKINFFDYDGKKLNKVTTFNVSENSWKEKNLAHVNLLPPSSKINVYDVTFGIRLFVHEDHEFLCVGKTKDYLCFIYKNRADEIYLLNVNDLQWIRLIVCFRKNTQFLFSWTSMRLYFVHLNQKESIDDVKFGFFPTTALSLAKLIKPKLTAKKIFTLFRF
jgi:hypothetical protein